MRDVALTQQNKLGVATTALAVLAIARLTLKPLGGSLPTHVELCLVCGSHGIADFALNVLLFIPLGFGLRLAGVRRRTAFAIVLLLTITIETLQFYVVTGRESDLSDIVSNTIGGVLGIALADWRGALTVPTPAGAVRLAALTALSWCAAAVFAQWILSVSFPHSIYYEQVAPDLGQFAVFDGTVLNASFNGAPFRIGRLSPDSSAEMRTAFLGGQARIEARILPGTFRPHLAPIVSVFDQRRREIFVLGRRHDDLVFRVRRRSDGLGFHPPSVVLSNALPAHSNPADTMRVGADVNAGATTLDAISRNTRAARRIDIGIWQCWRLLVPDDAWYGDYATLFTIVWIAGLAVPLGYWAGRAAGGGHSVSMAALIAIALLASLAIIPWVAGSPVAPWPVWAAAIGGVGVAWSFARWVHA